MSIKWVSWFIKFNIVGSLIGKFSFFSATNPQLSQWTTGIGHPQYLCRLSPQSRSRYLVTPDPQPCFSAKRMVSSITSSPVATSTPVKWFTHLTRSDLGGTNAVFLRLLRFLKSKSINYRQLIFTSKI